MNSVLKKITSFSLSAMIASLTFGSVINSKAETTLTVGSDITFGSYVQSAEEGAAAEPLEWRVLAVDGDKALLLTEKIIDLSAYNYPYTGLPITWAECTLRKFMNNTIYNTAFTGTERQAILLTHVVNNDNPCGTEGGEDTDDYLFALSAEEVTAYLDYNCIEDVEAGDWVHPARQAYYTDYAESKGAYHWDNFKTGFYWLRTPGEIPTEAANIAASGYGVYPNTTKTSSHYVSCENYGVRPAMYISISAYEQIINSATEAPTVTETPAVSTPTPSNGSADISSTDSPSATESPAVTTEAPAAATQRPSSSGTVSKTLNLDVPSLIILILVLAAAAGICYYCMNKMKEK